MTDPMPFEQFARLVRERRSSILVDPDRDVPAELVRDLCELGQWAPCHKRTWPTRYRLLTGDARAQLGKVCAAAMEARGDNPGKVEKSRTKYLRTPALLVVSSVPGDSELRTAENRDSSAASVEHILLGATAAGLASFWASCPTGAGDAVLELCDLEPGSTVVAFVYLGWPRTDMPVPERPEPDFLHLT